MLTTEKNNLRAVTGRISSLEQNSAFRYIHDFSTADLKKCILANHELSKPIEELIATCEAVFALIRNSAMEDEIKNAFYRLQIQFEFYRNLADTKSFE